MGVISVRLDNDTEARLKREAQSQGVSFSDFLRKRLTGEQQEPVETAREKAIYRRIACIREVETSG